MASGATSVLEAFAVLVGLNVEWVQAQVVDILQNWGSLRAFDIEPHDLYYYGKVFLYQV